MTCDDCTTSLWQYLRIRYTVDFSKYPCFHLAYYCSDEEDQCLEFDHGLFSIILDRKAGSSIVITYCSWCAKPLNTSFIPSESV